MNKASRKDYLSFNPDGIPDELKALDQWCCWKLQPRDKGKPGKVPTMAKDPRRNASATDSSTWSSFDEALSRYLSGDVNGVSFILTKEDPYTILDLDDVMQTDGSLTKSAAAMVKAFGSYTEISAGGSGLHVVTRGRLTGPGVHSHQPDYELYSDKKVIAMTGVPFGEFSPIEEGQRPITALEVLYREIKRRKEREASRKADRYRPSVSTGRDFPPRSDDDVIRLMCDHNPKAKALFDGRSEHGDPSRDDLALCAYLAYWTNGDVEQIDRIFRQSRLMREKWNRADYRRRTLGTALKGRR